MSGSLPFDRTADVLEQGGAVVLANVASSPAWPAGSNANRTGKAYDHSAEVELDALAAVQGSNRKLLLDGVTYSIVDYSPHEFLPHVELRLRKQRG